MCRIKRTLVTVLFLVATAPGGQTHGGCSSRPSQNCPQLDHTLVVVFQHEQYLDRYYRCLAGEAYEFQCPFDLVFDSAVGRCRHAAQFDVLPWQARQLMPCDKCVRGVKFVALDGFLPQYLQCVSEGIAELKTCPVGQGRTRSVQLVWMWNHCEGFLTTRGQRYEDYSPAFYHGTDNGVHSPFNNHHKFGCSHGHGFSPCDICKKTSSTATPCSTSTDTPLTTSTTTTEIFTTSTTTWDTTATQTTTESGNPDDYGIYIDDPLVGVANPIDDEVPIINPWPIKSTTSTTTPSTIHPDTTPEHTTTTTELTTTTCLCVKSETTTTETPTTTTTEKPTKTTTLRIRYPPIIVDPIPIEPIPVDPIPVDPKPVDPIPVDPIPVDPIPVDPIPVDPIPVEPIPVKPIPVDPIPVDPIPVDQ